MERDRLDEIIAAAEAVGAENERISALLLLPEVSQDNRLVAHYLKRQREIAPLIAALKKVKESVCEETLADLKREWLLLRVTETGEKSAYAGAGVCVRTRNNKDSLLADEVLRRLGAILPKVDFRLKERSGSFCRVECRSAEAYPILSALREGAFGEECAFALYPIMPDMEIREEEVRTDIFLNGGKGGQNVNKVETAVRMTHLPTGVTVVCRDERSQLQNKKRAARMLEARVKEYREEAQTALVDKSKAEVSR